MGLINVKLIKIFYGLLMTILLFVPNAFSQFIGPITIVEGKIGNKANEFFIGNDDMGPSVPWVRSVNIKGNIFLGDKDGIKIFNRKGNRLNTIKPVGISNVEGWPAFMSSDSKNNIYTSNYDNKLQKYNLKGELLWEKNIIVGDMLIQIDDSIFLWGYRPDQKDKENILHYSPIGQLLKAYDAKPLELGIVQEISSGGGNYENIIEFPDKKWKVKGLCMKYMRDACGILYCVDNAIVIRYDDEGRDVAFVGMPDEKIEQLPSPNPPGSGVDAPINVIEQYGSPVLAPNGDVYTWKCTPDKYSIIKWVWVDGPECPQYLDVIPTKNSLKFTWQKPTKDADKVTGYQLLQSYNICGPFRQTALLKKDQFSYEDRDVKKGETYYYIVKAVRGKDYSGNSNKVCGQIE